MATEAGIHGAAAEWSAMRRNDTSLVSVISGGVFFLLAVWSELSEVGGIGSTIAGWSMIFMTFAYGCTGLIVSWRYNQHARLKLREKEQFLVMAQSMGQNVQAKFWIFWISILIPVVYVIIGAVVGFVMGITSGSILAGIILQAQAQFIVEAQAQVVIGFIISTVLLCFSFAPSSFVVVFM